MEKAYENLISFERKRLTDRWIDARQQSYQMTVDIVDNCAKNAGIDVFYRNMIPMSAKYLLKKRPPSFTDKEVLENNDTDEFILRQQTAAFIEDFEENGRFLLPYVDEDEDEYIWKFDLDIIKLTFPISKVFERTLPWYILYQGSLFPYDCVSLRQQLSEIDVRVDEDTTGYFSRTDIDKIVKKMCDSLSQSGFADEIEYYRAWQRANPNEILPAIFPDDDRR